MDEDDFQYMASEGCPLHGDEYIRECALCGAEFCIRCFPNSQICPDCAEEANDEFGLDQDHGEDSEMKALDDLIGKDDEEIEKILNESEQVSKDDLPPELFEDDEGKES